MGSLKPSKKGKPLHGPAFEITLTRITYRNRTLTPPKVVAVAGTAGSI